MLLSGFYYLRRPPLFRRKVCLSRHTAHRLKVTGHPSGNQLSQAPTHRMGENERTVGQSRVTCTCNLRKANLVRVG